MPKLTETFVRKLPQTETGTAKHWDSEVKGLVMFVGKKAKTWYFQKDVGGRVWDVEVITLDNLPLPLRYAPRGTCPTERKKTSHPDPQPRAGSSGRTGRKKN